MTDSATRLSPYSQHGPALDREPEAVDPPTALAERDLLRLQLGQERVQHADARLALLTREHAALTTQRAEFAAALSELSDDLRARYQIDGSAVIDPETGAITRR